jgi:hypothetical protein
MEEMVAVASAAGELSEKARERLERAMAGVSEAADGPSYGDLAAKRDRLLAISMA